ncbi:MAG: hypothetical protein DRG71_02790 [Deltaproteobacteria bacterium]|nr:MAG: hypothetical protein DRG71_02790 [Deltaproteobacteria bacterium]
MGIYLFFRWNLAHGPSIASGQAIFDRQVSRVLSVKTMQENGMFPPCLTARRAGRRSPADGQKRFLDTDDRKSLISVLFAIKDVSIMRKPFGSSRPCGKRHKA